MSSIVNKVKEVLHSDNKTKTSAPEGTHGPHQSRVANAADPRIDSDRDHREAYNKYSNDASYTSSDNYSYGTTQMADRTGGPATRTDGPHSSNLANKADPRVDSDRDYSKNMGMNPQGTATTGTHVGGVSTSGAPATTGLNQGATTTTGPHNSKLANKLDPRIDSDLDGSRNMGMNAQGTAGTGVGTTGFNSGTRHGPASTTTGPHSSNLANKADPRVDSDLDGGRHAHTSRHAGEAAVAGGAIGAAAGAHHHQHGHHGGHHGTHASTTGSGMPGTFPAGTTSQGTHGLHSSHAANAMDPRVDSDLDGSRNLGMNQGGMTHTNAGVPASGMSGPASKTAGPHNSNLANKMDPRVDSDRDGSRNMGMKETGTGGGAFFNAGGAHNPSAAAGAGGLGGVAGTQGVSNYDTTQGTHLHGAQGTHMNNTVDPAMESDINRKHAHGGTVMGASGTTGAMGTSRRDMAGADPMGAAGGMGSVGVAGGNYAATGPAPHTAGPHKSDMMNKADPRVDSDLDGSKTVGKDKTYAQQGKTSLAGKDPTDAAQVPPSVLRKHVGEPVIEHQGTRDHTRRHSVSHQEQHRGF